MCLSGCEASEDRRDKKTKRQAEEKSLSLNKDSSYNIFMFKAGKVAIIGRPNVGKSTLLNTLVKEKVCIVSKTPETTRDNICGIISGKDFQVVFIDTPGIRRPKNLLGKTMVHRAASSLLEADIALVMVDGSAGLTQEDRKVFQRLSPEKMEPTRTLARGSCGRNTERPEHIRGLSF